MLEHIDLRNHMVFQDLDESVPVPAADDRHGGRGMMRAQGRMGHELVIDVSIELGDLDDPVERQDAPQDGRSERLYPLLFTGKGSYWPDGGVAPLLGGVRRALDEHAARARRVPDASRCSGRRGGPAWRMGGSRPR